MEKKKPSSPSAHMGVANTRVTSVLVNKQDIVPYNILSVNNIGNMVVSSVHKPTCIKPTRFYNNNTTQKIKFVI